MDGIAQAYEEATGRALTLHSKGSLEEGYAELERLKADGADLIRVLPASGKALRPPCQRSPTTQPAAIPRRGSGAGDPPSPSSIRATPSRFI